MTIRILLLFLALLCAAAAPALAARPNVVLIMTDDQGYGDLACHGNPVLKTPNLDQLHSESIRLTNFHVSPFCTPTRAALMTGRHPARSGAYRTSSGRSNLHHDEITMASHFAAAGYHTGMIGKWHLGDNAPCRPQDKGFHDVIWHKGGGIGQAADFYGNDQFDDTYERNGTYEPFEGYATDIWFAESMRFVEENKDKPFYLYVSLNAPHSPYKVPEEWAAPYREKVKWKGGAEFYGMITNLDHNLGLLREKLAALQLADNTIFIFLTDNGTSAGVARQALEKGDYRGFSAGMRGVKSTVYEGGHRVPFFIHWPAGGVQGGEDRAQLTAHLDVLPTLAELCGFSLADSVTLDGASFTNVLHDASAPAPRDHYITQLHGGARFVSEPKPFLTSCVVKDDWRLLDGEKLFNLREDPTQSRNVAERHSDVVAKLRALYLKYWTSVSPRMTPVALDLGHPAENPTTLCAQDWYLTTGNPPWNFSEINRLKRITGPWHVDVTRPGTYRFTLRQFPAVADRPVKAVRAKMRIAGLEKECPVEPGSKGVVFELDLPAGPTTLETWLYDEKDEAGGAYFTEVEWLGAVPDPRAAWMDEDKFGLFIHWGLYSQVARGEWYMHAKKVPVEEYAKLAETCNPTKFDAGEWVKIAKNAGMKYIVITSKHHDGFALFDSKASDYNIVRATPFKRDLIAELKQACDAEGIRLGLYYSHAQDWYHRGGSPRYNWSDPSSMDEMKDYLEHISLPQVKELLIQYDPDIIWYDTPRRMSPALSAPFSELVRELSPKTLINSRIALDGNKMGNVSPKDLAMLQKLDVDYLSYADREIPANSPWQHWETCMTLNGAWGFTRGDNNWKSPSHVIKQLLEVVSKGGAFLLNVGPDAEGQFPPESVAVLTQVGAWLKANGNAVYGAKPVSFNLEGTPTRAYLARKAAMEKRFAKLNRPVPHIAVERDFPWIATRNGDTIYITLFEWPGDTFRVEGFKHEIRQAALASDLAVTLAVVLQGETLTVTLPEKSPGKLPVVLCLTLGE